MKVPIDVDGFWFIVPLFAITVLFFVAGWTYPSWISVGLLLFVIYFFRNPERSGPSDEDLLLSPADGTVARIDTAYFSKDYPDGAVCISIFLSIFNVHVQRAPIAGEVIKKFYNSGKFLAAWNHKASMDNEQTQVILSTKIGPVGVKQIAGLVARRIVCRAKVGQTLNKGDRFGLIRFGSRVDLIVPANTIVVCKVGDKVKGGETVIARVGLRGVS